MSWLLPKQELGPDTITARPYQIEAIDAIRGEFVAGRRSTLLVLGTGLGKTTVSAKIGRSAVAKGKRVLFTAHRGELITQAAATFERVGILAGIERADSHARLSGDPDVVVATVQTLQGGRLESWDPDYFDLIIQDEAHRAISEQQLAIRRHFQKARVLGITATPDRTDKQTLKGAYESIAYEMNLWDAMNAPHPGPYLCRLDVRQCDLGIDLRNLKPKGEDYNDADLAEAIKPYVELIVNAIKQEVEARPTLVFAPDVASATALATGLQSIGMSADWVAGCSPDRDEKIAKYKDGETQVLVSRDLLLEGFDHPPTAAIVLCRPTTSRLITAQAIGRGTRLHGSKTNCAVIHFSYVTADHELVHPADIFDGCGIDPDVLSSAKKSLRDKPGQDLMEAIERARVDKEEQEELARQRVIRIHATERRVQYRRTSYDPCGVANMVGLKIKAPTEARFDPPTVSQVEYAKKQGIPNPEAMPKRLLSKILDQNNQRRQAGLASLKQVKFLQARGYDVAVARAMTLQQASEAIGQILGPISA